MRGMRICSTLQSRGQHTASCSDTPVDLHHCKEVTGTGIARMKSLENLGLDGTQLTDEGTEGFKTCPKLKLLRMHKQDKLTGTGLTGNTVVETVDVAGCEKFGDAGTAALATCTSLKMATISGTAVTGVGFTESLTDLAHVDMSDCKAATDIGISSLQTCGALTELILTGCTRITGAGLEGFE